MTGPLWTRMNAQPRRPVAGLRNAQIPSSPGVYAWYRNGAPVYAGVAAGGEGLHGRLGEHLGAGNDLTRSSFRRNVCELLGIAPTTVSRIRPTVLTPAQVAPVNAWISVCEVAWLECSSPDEADGFEKALLREQKPPLNRR